jgi:hypothetical protein
MMTAVPVFNPEQEKRGSMDFRNHDFDPEMRERDDVRMIAKIIGGCILAIAAGIAAHHYWPAISHVLGLANDPGL